MIIEEIKLNQNVFFPCERNKCLKKPKKSSVTQNFCRFLVAPTKMISNVKTELFSSFRLFRMIRQYTDRCVFLTSRHCVVLHQNASLIGGGSANVAFSFILLGWWFFFLFLLSLLLSLLQRQIKTVHYFAPKLKTFLYVFIYFINHCVRKLHDEKSNKFYWCFFLRTILISYIIYIYINFVSIIFYFNSQLYIYI